MDKAIAEQVWQYCHQQQNKEFQLWGATTSERLAEEHRQKCGCWAEIGNTLYRLYLQPHTRKLKPFLST